jgi:hypothetical protein
MIPSAIMLEVRIAIGEKSQRGKAAGTRLHHTMSGRTIETIANAAGWILQIVAHVDAQRRSRNAGRPDLRDQG